MSLYVPKYLRTLSFCSTFRWSAKIIDGDKMSKLNDRVDTLSKDVSGLKPNELRELQDCVTKNNTDILKVWFKVLITIALIVL